MKKNFIILILLISAFTLSSIAQVNYSFSAASATYVPVTGGITPSLLNFPFDYGGDTSYTYDEGMADSIPIGFTFTYNGLDYNYINVNANGFATLGSPFITVTAENYYINSLRKGPFTVFPYIPNDTLVLTGIKPVLAPLWDDLDCQADSNLRYITTGIPGNRIFTFEWSKVLWQYDATPSTISFELKLYEGTNIIEFCYKDEGGAPSSGASASIGITASKLMGGGFMSLQNTSASPLVSTITETDNLSVAPADNQVYRFTPLPCPLPQNVHFDTYTNNAITFSWNAPAGVTNFEYTVTNSPFGPASGISTTLTSATVASLQPDTQYYLHVRSVCSGSLQSAWAIAPLPVRTANDPVSIPYQESFENSDQSVDYYIPENSRLEDFDGTGALTYDFMGGYDYVTSWLGSDVSIPQYAYEGERYIYNPGNLNYQSDSWIYLPGINLNSAQSYKLKFHYTTDNLNNPCKMEVKYGQAVGKPAMTSGTLFTNSNINTADDVYVTDSTIFTPAASGIYYIGFHCFSDAGKGDLVLDAISLEAEGALPITLVNFSGEVTDKQNVLRWTTVAEENNTGFEIQRSVNGNNFSKIDFVNSKATNGNSNTKIDYDFADAGYSAGFNYYRLKQIDKDGKFVYSNIVLLQDVTNIKGPIIYPNPVSNILTIKIPSSSNQKLAILVTDIAGRKLQEKIVQPNSAETVIKFNVSGLSAGTYFLKILSLNGKENSIQKFIKE